jgi:chemotaxis protein MotB
MTRLGNPGLTAALRVRRLARPTRVGSERWMVSYADLVTLLFAFFVVLVALAPSAPDELSALAQSVQRVFRAERAAPPAGAGAEPHPADAAPVPLRADERGVSLTLPTRAFFHAGTATLRAECLPLLDEIGRFLATLEGPIVVEGHTAETPTGSSLFASPWDLSAARAARVVRHFSEACGLPPARLSAVGRGSSTPLDPESGLAFGGADQRLEIFVATGG